MKDCKKPNFLIQVVNKIGELRAVHKPQPSFWDQLGILLELSWLPETNCYSKYTVWGVSAVAVSIAYILGIFWKRTVDIINGILVISLLCLLGLSIIAVILVSLHLGNKMAGTIGFVTASAVDAVCILGLQCIKAYASHAWSRFKQLAFPNFWL